MADEKPNLPEVHARLLQAERRITYLRRLVSILAAIVGGGLVYGGLKNWGVSEPIAYGIGGVVGTAVIFYFNQKIGEA